MANFAYSNAAHYLFQGAVNLRETAITAPVGVNERNIRAALMSTTTSAGPAGFVNGAGVAENVLNLGAFTTFGEYNHASTYVPGFAGAGRKNLTTQSVTLNTTAKRSQFTADVLTWTALGASSVGTGAKGLLIFFQPTAAASDADNIPLLWIDTVASGTTFPFQGSGGDVNLTPNAIGLAIIGDRNLMSLV